MALASGSVFGRYRIDQIAGHGASSIVYRALDTKAARTVALKCLREELLVPAERERILARFHREAAIGELLVHPKIVRIFEHGEAAGLPYIAMEYVTGQSLEALIRQSGSLPLPVLCPIVVDLLEALAEAHARGVVHRDIKPANIVLRRADRDPVLMDFGIARAGQSELTQAGDWLGSPAFMAPEQIRGEAVDHRADLFAAGVVLYLGAVGQLPFDGSSIASVIYDICFREPAPPSSFNPGLADLDPIVAAALAKDAGQRYQSAAAFLQALRAVPAAAATDHAVAADPSSSPAGPDLSPTPAAAATQINVRAAPQAAAALGRMLARHAPLPPGRPAADGLDWSAGVRRLDELVRAAQGTPSMAETAQGRADLAHRLTAQVLVHASRRTNRLFADEAPDAASFIADLAGIDAIGEGLGLLEAESERRLVRACGDLLVGQILHRAAGVMEAYARTGDPLARFDVVNMLVRAEDLVRLAGRLLKLSPGADEDPVIDFAQESLSVFLDGIAALIAVSERDLTAALESDDPAAVSELIGHVKQIRLVYQFVTRLHSDEFRDRLADLSQRIYHLFTRLTATVASPAAAASSTAQGHVAALYEMADSLGWHELADQLLGRVRSSVLTG